VISDEFIDTLAPQQLRQAKDEVIARLFWYNQTRLHSTLAYLTHVRFEQDWLAAAGQASQLVNRLWGTDSWGKVALAKMRRAHELGKHSPLARANRSDT
jgi:hypothetical protein